MSFDRLIPSLPFAVWFGIFCLLCLISRRPSFRHFWHRWECVAAAASALFNFVVFGLMYYMPMHGGPPLEELIPRGLPKLMFHFTRFGPSALLLVVCVLVFMEREREEPLTAAQVTCRLGLTLGAFCVFALGDFVILEALKGPVALPSSWLNQEAWTRMTLEAAPRFSWAHEFGSLFYYLDLPFAISYFVLMIYWLLWLRPNEQPKEAQAFLGGASALEVLVQSLAHAAATGGF